MQLDHDVSLQLLFEIVETYFLFSKDFECMIFEYMDVEWTLDDHNHQILQQKNFLYYDM